ncbi:MAG: putative nucleic acid-binding protein [Verrucomicrobiales bacterium]|jgi:predicted nucleic acid-binding protein
MPYLIDANVLCESSKPKPDKDVLCWLADHDAELRVRALTLGEMARGIHLMDGGKSVLISRPGLIA